MFQLFMSAYRLPESQAAGYSSANSPPSQVYSLAGKYPSLNYWRGATTHRKQTVVHDLNHISPCVASPTLCSQMVATSQ